MTAQCRVLINTKQIIIPRGKILFLVSMAVKCDISLLGENKCLRKTYKKYTYMGLHNAG